MTKPAAEPEHSPRVKELCDRLRAEIDKQVGVDTKDAALRVKYLSEALRHLTNVNDPSEPRHRVILTPSRVGGSSRT